MPIEAHPASRLVGTPISPIRPREDGSPKFVHCQRWAKRPMGGRDEETSDVPGKPGNNFGNHDGKGFRASPSGEENTRILPVHMR